MWRTTAPPVLHPCSCLYHPGSQLSNAVLCPCVVLTRRCPGVCVQELKPWILCDGSTKFTYVNVSVKGARNNNEDAIYTDGQMFAVYDGHGGKHASLLAQKEIAKQFYKATGNATDEELVAPVNPGPPLVVDALDEAYAATQAAMPTSHSKSQAGSTGVTCWVHPAKQGGAAAKVFLAVLGDSQAMMFNCHTGEIPHVPTRTWDEEQGTLMGPGVKATRASVTEPHAITGALKVDKTTGRAIGMRHDPLGVGFREYNLLKKRHKFPPTKVPFCISNMPGEERWRLLNLEPTRALGHRNNKEPPMRHPEVYEWEVTVRIDIACGTHTNESSPHKQQHTPGCDLSTHTCVICCPAVTSRLLKIIGLFCRMYALL